MIAVCIVGFRNAADIALCLRQLQQSVYREFEVVICENGGSQSFAELRNALPPRLTSGQTVTLIEAEGNLGYAGGVNRCMRMRSAASGWWILNPDTVPSPDALGALVARLDMGDVAAVGGVLHDERGRVQTLGGRWRRRLGRAEAIGHGAPLSRLPAVEEIERQLDFLSGASCLIGPALVRTVGLMREDYFLYAEEVEWFVRARQHGLRIGFSPDARVLHHQGATTGSAASLTARPRLPIYLDERNRMHVVRDTDRASLPLALAASSTLSALRFARRGAWRQWRWALQGWLAALRNERGVPPWL